MGDSLGVVLNWLLNIVLFISLNFSKSNKMTSKTQCVKIWDKYTYVNGLLYEQKVVK